MRLVSLFSATASSKAEVFKSRLSVPVFSRAFSAISLAVLFSSFSASYVSANDDFATCTSALEQKAQQQESEQEQQVLEQEQQQIKELKARDTEVRIHEQAHASVGGKYAGSPSYEYQRGPDGTNYAVGGEVQIDVAEIPGDPQATIEKMQTVRAAALAPAEPSGADRSIAADATQKLVAAQAELAAPQNEEDDSAENNSKASFTSSEAQETKTAESEEQTRDADVEARAGRIANFYQMATSPSTQSGFSAIS